MEVPCTAPGAASTSARWLDPAPFDRPRRQCLRLRISHSRGARTPGGPVARHPQPRGRKSALRREIPSLLRGFQGRLCIPGNAITCSAAKRSRIPGKPIAHRSVDVRVPPFEERERISVARVCTRGVWAVAQGAGLKKERSHLPAPGASAQTRRPRGPFRGMPGYGEA